MLEFIFSWTKASKCKKLIRKVQCRLKLLKNKRCTIVGQVRDDVSQLLKDGKLQSAFNRVEQIYKDECIVVVYDLLDQFCDFININLSYIFRHKDCPNDINEAISTLIFASARCGDIPELRAIRKLFGEHYGERFSSIALGLFAGHLINKQVRENLSITSVDNDVKHKLFDEIARSCLKSGPLVLDYSSEFNLQKAIKNDDFVPSNDVCKKPQQQDTNKAETEEKIVHVDISLESKSFQEPPKKKNQEISKTDNVRLDYPLEHEERNNGKDNDSSNSDNLSNVLEEMVYLDDIEEFRFPLNKEDDKGQSQRVFKFKHFATPTREKYEGGYDSEIQYEEQYDHPGKKKSTEKGEKRSTSLENGKSYIGRAKLYHPCIFKIGNEFVQGKFVCFKDQKEQVINHNVSLENPCHLSIRDGEKEEVFEEQVCYMPTFSEQDNLVPQQLPLHVGSTMPISDDQLSKMQKMKLDSTNNPSETKETRRPYQRATTIPLGRPKDRWADNNIGRATFPSFSCPSPHVHPKLPDYDELVAMLALKKAYLQTKKQKS